MEAVAPSTLTCTPDRDLLTNLYYQPSIQQPKIDPFLVFSWSRPMNSQRKMFPVGIAFFYRNCLLECRLNETIATVEDLSAFANLEQKTEFFRMWWSVNSAKFSYLFELFLFYRLLAICFCYFCAFLNWKNIPSRKKYLWRTRKKRKPS